MLASFFPCQALPLRLGGLVYTLPLRFTFRASMASVASIQAAGAQLLDFSKAEFDMTALEQLIVLGSDPTAAKDVVRAAEQGQRNTRLALVHFVNLPPPPCSQREAAKNVIMAFQDHPNAWMRADRVYENGSQLTTRFFGLQLLESAVKFRWGTIPEPQQHALRTYIVRQIVGIAGNEASFADRSMRTLLGKLNGVLVEIVKRDWPQKWPNFIPEILESSDSSETLCENNMRILTMLSEDVFDFSEDSMLAHRVKELKGALNEQFIQIFKLCDAVLGKTQRPSLLVQTLDTLQNYMTWIPVVYIMETQMLTSLCTKYLPSADFRVPTLRCLTEVAALSDPKYNEVFLQLFGQVISAMLKIVPPGTDLGHTYTQALQMGDEAAEQFVYFYGLFLTSFFRHHLALVENPATRDALAMGMGHLVSMTSVHEDAELFRVCLEFWQWFAQDLHNAEIVSLASAPTLPTSTGAATGSGGLGGGLSVLGGVSSSMGLGGSSLGLGGSSLGGGGLGGAAALQAPAAPSSTAASRKALYGDVLSRLRTLLIEHMVRPEEVLVEETESGKIVHSTVTSEEALGLHHNLKETLVYLTHLDKDSMLGILVDKLARVMDGSAWSYENLNKLCWGVGAITRTLEVKEEKRFLVKLITDLLELVKLKRTADEQAVVASNIMYVVGQYPRFLRKHWVFLKTVVLKLFQFMREEHPGVKDMAVDTFYTIVSKCRKQFVCVQTVASVSKGTSTSEPPFVGNLSALLPSAIEKLEGHQVLRFFEASALMVSAHPTTSEQERLTAELMKLVNTSWAAIVDSAATNIEALREPTRLKELTRIYNINAKVASAVGGSFAKQLAVIFNDMLSMYSVMQRFILEALNSHGSMAASTPAVIQLRKVRVAILDVLIEFLAQAEDGRFVVDTFVTHITEPVFGDYKSSPAVVREAQVLKLMSTVLKSCRVVLAPSAIALLGYVFEPTLNMITANFEDHLDHRIAFFDLLECITQHHFESLLGMPDESKKLLVNSIIWAFKHTDRQVSNTGLSTLKVFLTALEQHPNSAEVAQPVYSNSFMDLLQDLLRVITDRMHKSQLAEHCMLLQHLLALVVKGRVTVPLWSNVAGATPPADGSNVTFLRHFLSTILAQSFPHLTAEVVTAFAGSLLATGVTTDAYLEVVRDFLIRMLQFSADANASELFADKAAAASAAAAQAQAQVHGSVPGLAPPDDDDDL